MAAITAKGEFDVNLTPVEGGALAWLGRLTIAKTFRGDLAGTSAGEMIAASFMEAGSAGYVALEQVEAALHGRRGSFILQHHAIMDRGAGRLEIEVVPDSGTGELTGLTGRMAILIEDGKHFYEFIGAIPDR